MENIDMDDDLLEMLYTAPKWQAVDLARVLMSNGMMKDSIDMEDILEIEKRRIDDEICEMTEENLLDTYLAARVAAGNPVDLEGELRWAREYEYEDEVSQLADEMEIEEVLEHEEGW